MDDEALAAFLQVRLKPARGCAPKVTHVRAAILMARDNQLDSREACRYVDGVPQGAHARIAALAPRVRELLREFTDASAVQSTYFSTAQPAPAAAPSRRAPWPTTLSSPAASASLSQDLPDFLLPPLTAVPCAVVEQPHAEQPCMPEQPSTPVLPSELLPQPDSGLPLPASARSSASVLPLVLPLPHDYQTAPPERACDRRDAHVLRQSQHIDAAEQAEHATLALQRLSAWSDQLPDEPRTIDGSWDNGSCGSTSQWDGRVSAADECVNSLNDTGAASSKRAASMKRALRVYVADKHIAAKHAAAERAAEKRAADKRAAEKRAADIAAEQWGWNDQQHWDAEYDYQ